MDTATLKKLLTRANDCIGAALCSIESGHPEQAEVTIRTAFDLLAYIETKHALASDPSTAAHHG